MNSASEDCVDGGSDADEHEEGHDDHDDQGGVNKENDAGDANQGGGNSVDRRRSARTSKAPERFTEEDYDGLARVVRESLQDDQPAVKQEHKEEDKASGDMDAGIVSTQCDDENEADEDMVADLLSTLRDDEMNGDVTLITGSNDENPKNQHEARARPDAQRWMEAELTQLADLKEQGAYEVVD